jgi:hypothetical protein
MKEVPFAGGTHRFPEGAFRFARHLERNVYFIASVREAGFYRVFVRLLPPEDMFGSYVRELEALVEKYPDQWYQWETILSHHTLIVYPRDGIDFENLKKIYPQAVFLDKAPQFLISATQIRQHINEKDFVSKWLHEEVYKFIKNNKLYYK